MTCGVDGSTRDQMSSAASVELDGQAHTIVGVMPATFTHPYPSTQLWTPVALSTTALDDRKQRPYRVVARLRDGVTRERAEVELRAIAERLAREHPDTHAGLLGVGASVA